jgi:hypothetical protein
MVVLEYYSKTNGVGRILEEKEKRRGRNKIK